MNCPSCGRPVAVARAACLYCGGALSAEAVAAAQAARRATAERAPVAEAVPEEAAAERRLLVLDAGAANAATLARALGVSAYEAGQRVRRGGLQLLKLMAPEHAGREVTRLRALGLRIHDVAERDTRLPPVVVLGGLFDGQALELRVAGGRLRLAASDLALVVRGPIAREYQTRMPKKSLPLATLEPGYRFHLHRAALPAPVEIDPWGFGFGPGTDAGQSSLLTLLAWVSALANGVPIDDGFRQLPPALAPEAEDDAPGASALRLGRKQPEKKEASLVLDNLRQFRFYSAWRGAVERSRRG
jgi:hypothetical protein